MRTAESIGAVQRERERESYILANVNKNIEQSKGEKAFIGDEIKDRLNLLSRI